MSAEPTTDEQLNRALNGALLCLDEVSEEHQRMLAEARRHVVDLHREATRAGAGALAAAHRALADAEEEAASLLRAAQEEASRLRAESEKELQATAQAFLAGLRRTKNDTLSAANSEAERTREEARAARDSIMEAAYHEAARTLRKSRDEATSIRGRADSPMRLEAVAQRGTAITDEPGHGSEESSAEEQDATAVMRSGAPPDGMPGQLQEELRVLMAQVGQVLERLPEAAAATDQQSPARAVSTEARSEQSEHPPSPVSPSPDASSVPFIGSRGQHRGSQQARREGVGERDAEETLNVAAEAGNRRANGNRRTRPVTRRGWRPRVE